MKKLLPIIFIVILAIVTIAIKRCNNRQPATTSRTANRTAPSSTRVTTGRTSTNRTDGLDRNTNDLYFTKHAKCRMRCRQISQDEVKDILAVGKINYNKSNLNDPKGPTYALEGDTDDGQHVRIIFAPKQKHLTVVTVIDLGVEHQCNCN